MHSQPATIRTEAATSLVFATLDRQTVSEAHGTPDMVHTVCRAASQALEHAGIGLILTDKRAGVRFVNTIAQPQLTGSVLSLQHGHLVGSSRIDTARLHNAITAATARGNEAARTIPLCAWNGGEPQHVLVAPLAPLRDADTSDPLAMIVLASRLAATEESRFRKAFGLTAAEARLLSALVDGERLADYAERNGIRMTTAKTHLSSLFAKTGEKRQADLIRRALSDPTLRLHVDRREG